VPASPALALHHDCAEIQTSIKVDSQWKLFK
jgi:hypothetical protein